MSTVEGDKQYSANAVGAENFYDIAAYLVRLEMNWKWFRIKIDLFKVLENVLNFKKIQYILDLTDKNPVG